MRRLLVKVEKLSFSVFLGVTFSLYRTCSLEHKHTVLFGSEQVHKSSAEFTQRDCMMLFNLIFVPRTENP